MAFACAVLCVLSHLGCPVRARSEEVGVACGPLHVVYNTVMGVCLERRRGDVEKRKERVKRCLEEERETMWGKTKRVKSKAEKEMCRKRNERVRRGVEREDVEKKV